MITICVAREKYESLVEKESRKSQLNSVGHNHSHDSAIDADLQEWELETLRFEIVSWHQDHFSAFQFIHSIVSSCEVVGRID